MHPTLYRTENKLITGSGIRLSLKQLAIPIRKDATSSVYQLMSVIANDRNLAKKTYIINNGYIVDLYALLYNKFFRIYEKLTRESNV